VTWWPRADPGLDPQETVGHVVHDDESASLRHVAEQAFPLGELERRRVTGDGVRRHPLQFGQLRQVRDANLRAHGVHHPAQRSLHDFHRGELPPQ
jgi:hypothetical protein